jgi:AcrR family transcriptional regulator
MKENQRVRLTKKMLQDSLIWLLPNKSIHKISVREICDNAEINRSTFYKYYGSQYDLLKDMENEVLLQIDGYLNVSKDQPDYDVLALTRIAVYCRKILTCAGY